MANYYPRMDWKQPPTLIVEALREALRDLPGDLLVLFTVPEFGAFGGGQQYTLSKAEVVDLPREENIIPEHEVFNEEDGTTYVQEEEVQVFHAWKGVVIS